jgi:hypothetical protein
VKNGTAARKGGRQESIMGRAARFKGSKPTLPISHLKGRGIAAVEPRSRGTEAAVRVEAAEPLTLGRDRR